MCGRYALAQEHEALRVRFGLVDDPTSTFAPRYNIAPTQNNPVVIRSQQNELVPMRWGLIPHWAKDPKIGNRMINTKSETAAEKPSFRDSFKKRRCLIPATGFYEWKTIPASKSKQPMYVSLKDQEIFAFAGLWSCWHDPKGDDVLSYTILTREPNEFMKQIHHRMPVILTPDAEDPWLDPDASPGDLQELLAPYPADQMIAHDVSKVVNSPANDVPECVAPV